MAGTIQAKVDDLLREWFAFHRYAATGEGYAGTEHFSTSGDPGSVEETPGRAPMSNSGDGSGNPIGGGSGPNPGTVFGEDDAAPVEGATIVDYGDGDPHTDDDEDSGSDDSGSEDAGTAEAPITPTSDFDTVIGQFRERKKKAKLKSKLGLNGNDLSGRATESVSENANRGGPHAGIPGNLSEGSLLKIMAVLYTGKNPRTKEPIEGWTEDLLISGGQFLDVGSGLGHPVAYAAVCFRDEIACAFGIENAPRAVFLSCVVWRNLDPTFRNLRMAFFERDAKDVDSYNPVTHVYAFVGEIFLMGHVIRIAMNSPMLRMLIIIPTNKAWLETCGLLTTTGVGDDDVFKLPVQMSAKTNKGHTCYFIPMTEDRLSRVQVLADALGTWTAEMRRDFELRLADGSVRSLEEESGIAQTAAQRETTCEGMIEKFENEGPPPRRAALAAAGKITAQSTADTRGGRG